MPRMGRSGDNKRGLSHVIIVPPKRPLSRTQVSEAFLFLSAADYLDGIEDRKVVAAKKFQG
jgi:hypothetical protein